MYVETPTFSMLRKFRYLPAKGAKAAETANISSICGLIDKGLRMRVNGQRMSRLVTILMSVVVKVEQHRRADAANTLLALKHTAAMSDINSTINEFLLSHVWRVIYGFLRVLPIMK